MMIDSIMGFIAWAIIINVLASIYVFAVSRFLPHFLFVPRYKSTKITDRGLKKYVFPDGRGVLYEPDIKYRGFIKKYLLFEYKGNKYIKCHLSDRVDSLRYEVALYNNKHRLIKVMEVSENIFKSGETKNTLLPKNTSYASVVINKVNESLSFDTLKSISILRIAVFSVITAAMTVVYGALTRGLIMFVNGFFGGDLAIGIGVNIASSLIVSVMVIALSINICKKRIFGKG